jgi:L-cystine uptake protein TcyP (sodium:dicarboxylate symporter family)
MWLLANLLANILLDSSRSSANACISIIQGYIFKAYLGIFPSTAIHMALLISIRRNPLGFAGGGAGHVVR